MYPLTYELENPGAGRNRLTAFFRYLLAIPWLIVLGIFGIVAEIAAIIAWFAIVFTGRYPDGLYEFNAGFVRLNARVTAFYYLATDEWPPFGGAEDPSYPVRAGVPAPLPAYDRLKTGLRLIFGIPVYLLAIVQGIIAAVIAIIAWFAILFTGQLSEGLFTPLRSALAYNTRAVAYFLLLTEEWPPFTLEETAAPPPPPPPAAPVQ